MVLVGPSGTGKTTWAHEHFTASEIVSSDALRALVGIDEADLMASAAAFDLLHRIVSERLRRGLTTVIDTTGLDKEDRLRWVESAREVELPVYAVLFTAGYDEVAPRHAGKPRPIPQATLRKQFSRMSQAVVEIPNEGFDEVHTEQPVRVVATKVVPPSAPTEPQRRHSFGLIISRFNWEEDDLGGQLAQIARRAEEAGFSDLWLMDHFRQIPVVGRNWEDIPEAYTALAHIGASTERIRLGTLVTGVTHRSPVVLGKMVATLDVLTGGRAICGLGAAWDQAEHKAYGIPFPPLTERYALLEDTLQMLPLLWGKGSSSFEGATFSASELICYPRPIQDPIPILVGGGGEKRTLHLVAEYADACNVMGSPEEVRHKVEVLERHCADVRRDPAEILVTNLHHTLVARDRPAMHDRIHQLRSRNQSVEQYAVRHNAGTVEDLVDVFSAYSEAGARHTIVSLPDVALEGSIETFGDVIAAFE